MERLYKLQKLYLAEINRFQDVADRDSSLEWEKIHMASSARIAFLLAKKRKVDADMAAIACTIHDIGRVHTGKQKGHAEAGYEPAKAFLSGAGLFSEEEIELLATAVRLHSSKAQVDFDIAEIVKDADVLDCHYYGQSLPRQEQRDRLAALLVEMEIE